MQHRDPDTQHIDMVLIDTLSSRELISSMSVYQSVSTVGNKIIVLKSYSQIIPSTSSPTFD